MTHPAASEWRSGWRVVTAGFIGLLLINLQAGALGAVMTPLTEIFGWSRAQVSASVMIGAVLILLIGPFTGHLVDKIGPRRVALTGVVLYCAALASVGLSGPQIWTWYLAWTLVGLVYTAAGSIVWTTAIGRWFVAHRGLALSVALSGTGIANFISPVFSVWLLENYGWRGVYFVLAAVGLVVAFPLIWYLMKPAVAQDGAPSTDRATLPGLPMRGILRSSRFWRLAATMVLTSAGVSTLFYHFQPMMRDAGISAGDAAGYAALMGPTLILGRIAGGYLLDHLSSRLVAAASFLLPAVACALLIGFDGSPAIAILAALIIGLSFGAEGDVVAYLSAQYFGLRHYALTYALVYGLYALGFGVAPVVAGAAFDAFGSYDAMLQALIVGLVLSGLLAATLGKPPKFEESAA